MALPTSPRTILICGRSYSDSHIAGSTAKVWRGQPMYDNAQRVNREMFGLPKRPCGLIHLGDCAFKAGLAEDYETFRSTIPGDWRSRGFPSI
jgi:hypothetical protein